MGSTVREQTKCLCVPYTHERTKLQLIPGYFLINKFQMICDEIVFVIFLGNLNVCSNKNFFI